MNKYVILFKPSGINIVIFFFHRNRFNLIIFPFGINAMVGFFFFLFGTNAIAEILSHYRKAQNSL